MEKNDYSLLENQILGDNVELIIFRDYSRISTNSNVIYAQWLYWKKYTGLDCHKRRKINIFSGIV